MRKQTNDHVG